MHVVSFEPLRTVDERTCMSRISAVFIKACLRRIAILLLYILHKIPFFIALHSIAVMGEVFRIRSGLSRGLPSLPYIGHWLAFRGIRRPHNHHNSLWTDFRGIRYLVLIRKFVEQIADLSLLLHRASCRFTNHHTTNNCTNCMSFILTFRNRASYIYRTGTPLPSKHPILYIYSTNTRTEYFKHAAHSPFFFLFKMPFIS